jgi:hypothetical protein
MTNNTKQTIRDAILGARQQGGDKPLQFMVHLAGAIQREDATLANELLALVEGEA